MQTDKNFLRTLLLADNPVEAIKINLDKLVAVIPEIKAMIGFDHKHPHHHLDVWEHTLYALSLSKNDFDVRLILLLHDIGKPHSFKEIDGVRRFNGHPQVSCDIATTILNRLNFEQDYVQQICLIIARHDTPLTELDVQLDKQLAQKIFAVQRCDALAHNPAKNQKRVEYIAKIISLLGE